MQLKYINPSLQKDWEDLAKSNPASGFMQSYFWTNFKQLLGWETFKIGVFEKNKLIGGAVVGKYSHYKNRSFLVIPEGPVLPYKSKNCEKVFHALISEIDKIANLTSGKLSSHLSIEPKLEAKPKYFSRFKKAKTDNQPIKTLVIDLSQSEDEILKQMKPKGRYDLKIAQREKVEVTHMNLSEGLDSFLKLYKRYTTKENFAVKDESYFQALAGCVDAENGEIYLAKYKSKVLAAAIVIYYGNTATFLFGAISDKHKNVMASYLLQFEIIKHAKKLHLKWYDLYALSPDEENPKHPWYGFSVFKRKFGGREVNFIGAYDFIYNKKLYREFEKNNLSSEQSAEELS